LSIAEKVSSYSNKELFYKERVRNFYLTVI